MINRNLVFDIGLHKGFDTAYYLKKGFTVVGVEARADLCEEAREANLDAVQDDRLIIVEKALSNHQGETISFFINPEKDDWGSVYRLAAEKGMNNAVEITVETTTLFQIVQNYGTPYYIKCDIEGADSLVAEQIVTLETKPCFVSLELTQSLDIARLAVAGYDRFQIVNQFGNPGVKVPFPTKEGLNVEQAFSHEMSGLFGLDLPVDGWKTFDAISDLFRCWLNLQASAPGLAVGWLDIHATHSTSLA